MPYLVCEGLLRQGAATMVAGAATMVAGAVTVADLMAVTAGASIEEHHDDSVHDWCSLVAVDSQ
jgi:hypothetical protein